MIRDEGFQLLEFSPLGIIQSQKKRSYIHIDNPSKLIAISEGIESDVKVITFTLDEFSQKCSKVDLQEWACIRPRMVKQVENNCLSSLYFGHGSQPCKVTSIFKKLPKEILRAGLIETSAMSGQFVTFFLAPTEISLHCNGKRETHVLFGYQLWPANASRCEIFSPAWDIAAAPRPIFEAELISKVGPNIIKTNPDSVLANPISNSTNHQSSGAINNATNLDWVDMDLNATVHRSSSQFQSTQMMSISALAISIISMLMASGITVIFKRNFGFLLSPFKVPIEGVASAIAQRLGTNHQINAGNGNQDHQNQLEMVDLPNQDNQDQTD